MNYRRNYYVVSHGKLICECWTLLLGNLAMPTPGGMWTPRQSSSPLQPCGGNPSLVNRGDRTGNHVWPACPGTDLGLRRRIFISLMLALWAVMWLDDLGWVICSVSLTVWHAVKCCRQFHPSEIFLQSHRALFSGIHHLALLDLHMFMPAKALTQ